MQSRSKLVPISSLWLLIYALFLLPSPSDVTGAKAFVVVFLIWPGFLLFQLLCYGLFKQGQNIRLYTLLFIVKSGLFLIQTIMITHQLLPLTFLSAIIVLLIDLLLFKRKHMANVRLHELSLTKEESAQNSERWKRAWLTIGPVVLLFSLYFELSNAHYQMIIYLAVIYSWLFLKSLQPKWMFASIQLIGFILVYFITLIPTFEVIRGALLIGSLIALYQMNKYVYMKHYDNQEETAEEVI